MSAFRVPASAVLLRRLKTQLEFELTVLCVTGKRRHSRARDGIGFYLRFFCGLLRLIPSSDPCSIRVHPWLIFLRFSAAALKLKIRVSNSQWHHHIPTVIRRILRRSQLRLRIAVLEINRHLLIADHAQEFLQILRVEPDRYL